MLTADGKKLVLDLLGLTKGPSQELQPLLAAMRDAGLERLLRHGDFERFFSVSERLSPSPAASVFDVDAPLVRLETEAAKRALHALKELGPWRKGPFALGQELLDAEWRSDQKWARVVELASPFDGRRVLDVGCGNGYYLLRLEGSGVAAALGVEPSVLYVSQFLALSRLFAPKRVALLPATLEELPTGHAKFDTVLSMGVLYHRRDPLAHLRELREHLAPRGELLLETLILESDEETSIAPKDRYAMMRNVFTIPSPRLLGRWLSEVGFGEVVLSSAVRTTEAEQRSTPFSEGPSLRDFLDPEDLNLTVEGYPAPVRLLLRAKKL